jgi:hypothetical protein
MVKIPSLVNLFLYENAVHFSNNFIAGAVRVDGRGHKSHNYSKSKLGVECPLSFIFKFIFT